MARVSEKPQRGRPKNTYEKEGSEVEHLDNPIIELNAYKDDVDGAPEKVKALYCNEPVYQLLKRCLEDT